MEHHGVRCPDARIERTVQSVRISKRERGNENLRIKLLRLDFKPILWRCSVTECHSWYLIGWKRHLVSINLKPSLGFSSRIDGFFSMDTWYRISILRSLFVNRTMMQNQRSLSVWLIGWKSLVEILHHHKIFTSFLKVWNQLKSYELLGWYYIGIPISYDSFILI